MRAEDLVTSDLTAISTAGANAVADATISAPGENKRIVVTGITVSANGAPTSAVEVTLVEDTGGTPITREAFFLPNGSVFSPVIPNYRVPLRIGPNKDVRLRIPALGAGVTGRAVIKYDITTAA